MPAYSKLTRKSASRFLLACFFLAWSGAACESGEDERSCDLSLVATAYGTITGSDGNPVVADSVQLFANEAGPPGQLLEECSVEPSGDYYCVLGAGRPLILRVTLGSAIEEVAFESLLTSDGCKPVPQTIDVMLDEP